jgi:Arc-like DNA binding dprotein
VLKSVLTELTRTGKYAYDTNVSQITAGPKKMKRRRAPGGGRKPKGPISGLTSPLSVRMPPEMRSQLASAAKKRGVSFTQEILWRLRRSLSQNREDRRDRATRAYCFLISEIVDQIKLSAHFSEIVDHTKLSADELEWYRNPFAFRAFRLGVAKLLEELEPAGESKSLYTELKPESLYEQWLFDTFRTPEAAADMAAQYVLRDLLDPSPSKEAWKTAVRETVEQQFPARPDVAEELMEHFEASFYGMSDVRRDLGIDKPQEPKS